MNLWFAFKRLLLSFVLIILTAGILLVSDWNGNPSLVTAAKPLNRIWQVALSGTSIRPRLKTLNKDYGTACANPASWMVISDAALALTTRKIDAVCQISDNLTSATFTTIAIAARRAKLPVFSFNSPQVNQGAHIVLSRDFRDGGRESALLAAPIMQGESPATIPFKPTTRTRLLINTTTARSAGLTIPRPVLERADELIK